MAARNNSKSASHGDKRRAGAIINEVHELMKEMQALLLGTNKNHKDGTSIIGSRVKIIKGVNNGLIGRVISKRGEQYWNIVLETDAREVYKKLHMLEVMPA